MVCNCFITIGGFKRMIFAADMSTGHKIPMLNFDTQTIVNLITSKLLQIFIIERRL
jgi:hypothetical protein